MKHYSQQDPLWRNKQLGEGEFTIGDSGCFLTCFSMLTGIDPATLNDKIKVKGGFQGSLLIAGIVPSVCPSLYIDSTTFCMDNLAPLDVIDNALTSGKSVIVGINKNSHYVILTGKVGNDYSMVDPWPLVDEPPATLLNRYGNGKKAEVVITYILAIGGVEVSDTNTQTDVSTDVVTVITDYINIRLDPSTNRAGVGRVLYGMDLETCGEPVNGFYPVKLWVSSGNGEYLE
jgi:hypothetical protein